MQSKFPEVCVRLLLGGLSRRQGGGYRASWLRHVEKLLLISSWSNQTLVFMAPHNQVNEIIQELLRNVVCGTMFTPKRKKAKQQKTKVVLAYAR